MSGINRGQARLGYGLIGYLEAMKLDFNNPTNVDNVNVFDHDGKHAVFRSDVDEIGPLALQQGDHYDNLSSGEGGYAACMHHLTATGQRIATVSADVTTDSNGNIAHNHWGVYTNAGINADGSDSQPVKRLNLQAGSANVRADWNNINEMRMRPAIDNDQTEAMMLRLQSSDGTQHSKVSFGHQNDSVEGEFGYDGGKGDLRIVSGTGSGTADVRITDGVVKVVSGGVDGRGRIELGHNGAGLEVNSNGEVQVEDESGNTTVIS